MLYLIDVSRCFLSFCSPWLLGSVLGGISRTARFLCVLLLRRMLIHMVGVQLRWSPVVLLHRMLLPLTGVQLRWSLLVAVSGVVDSHAFLVFFYDWFSMELNAFPLKPFILSCEMFPRG